jgi:hypothetical protein
MCRVLAAQRQRKLSNLPLLLHRRLAILQAHHTIVLVKFNDHGMAFAFI